MLIILNYWYGSHYKNYIIAGVAASVQRESLHSYAFLCSQLDEGIRLKTEVNEGLLLQLPAEFPSLLVPLSSDDMVITCSTLNRLEVHMIGWQFQTICLRIGQFGNF